MNLKNYTSSVATDRSVSLIQHCLVAAGAKNISLSYNDKGELVGMLFQVFTAHGPVVFKLPAKVDACFQAMWKEVRRPRKETEGKLREQAGRTAWKILYDWVAVQVSLIQLEQAEIIEVFLPYAWDARKDQTYFEKMKANNFKQLEPAKEP